MIDVKELRIGNTFWDNYGGYYNVTSINCNKVGDMPNTVSARHIKGGAIGQFDCDKIEPIELTEEHLLRFGFINDNASYWKQTDGLIHYLELIPAQGLYYPVYAQVGEVSSESEQRVNLNYIQYVHTLQNLFYCLTGTELQYK